MAVCQECGVNPDLFKGSHLPVCSKHEPTNFYPADAEDKNLDNRLTGLMDACAERGLKMAEAMFRKYSQEVGMEDEAEEMLDESVRSLLTLASQAGAIGALQVFEEQKLLDVPALVDYLTTDFDSFEW